MGEFAEAEELEWEGEVGVVGVGGVEEAEDGGCKGEGVGVGRCVQVGEGEGLEERDVDSIGLGIAGIGGE